MSNKRETVIKGLKYLHDVKLWHEGLMISDSRPEVRRTITADAIALLKAQEPRVMTLEEIINSQLLGLVYYECKGESPEPAYIFHANKYCVDVMTMGKENTEAKEYKDYGVHWRAWNNEPTEAQREAEPWNN